MTWLDHVWQDIRYALRGLRRDRGFAATVIVTLGLGIGANAAMFGVVDRLMFRPFPYLRDPGQVHRVYLRSSDRGTVRTTSSEVEYTRYLDLSRWTSSFSHIVAFSSRRMAVGSGEATRERQVAMVSASFFQFFDARPALGRYFLPAEDVTPRGADVVVLGHAFWKTEFGGRDVIGEPLQVGAVSATIIGVAAEGFAGVRDGNPPAAYLPITTYAWAHAPSPTDRTNYYTRYNWGWMSMMVRRKPGVTVERASADLSQAYVRSWDADVALGLSTPSSVARPEAVAGALRTTAGPDPGLEERTALWVAGVAAIVLLIACANVANLFLTRAIRRRRETAVRLSLGVSRWRLAMQTFTECLVVAGLGGAAGLLVAEWGGTGVRRLLVSGGAVGLEVFTDWRTLWAAAAVALLAGVLTALAPVLLAGRGDRDLMGSLKSGSREGTYRRSRTRAALLVIQGALSMVLLVGAGLFVRSLSHVRSMRLGYDPAPVLLVTPNLRGLEVGDSAEVQLGRDLLAAAQAIPGVERAAWVSNVPFWFTQSTHLFVAGIDSVRRLGSFTFQAGTSDYFAAAGTRILRGRGFTPEDRGGAPRIVVVSESMAAVLWPGQEALGQCLRVRQETAPCSTVVGIAEDIVQGDIAGSERFHYYMPIEQYQPTSGFALMLRMRGDPAQQAGAVNAALQRVMPGQGYVVVYPFKSLVDGQMRSWRLGATMFVAFGVLALAVAAVGLYGTIGYHVTQRMHELGVRMALGAQSLDVVRLVVRQGLGFASAGVTLGFGLAWLAGRWVEPLLFRQSPRDPLVIGVVSSILLAVALAASAVPAARAARADPSSALRSD